MVSRSASVGWNDTVKTQFGQVEFIDEDVDYALHVELGTSKMSAQPYLRPAMLQVTGADFRYAGAGPETRGVRKERAATARARRREWGA